jgi:sulfur carrier protein
VRVLVNGEVREIAGPVTVAELVAAEPRAPGGRGVAVAVDGEVIPRGEWSATELRDAASVEIVVAVQGG